MRRAVRDRSVGTERTTVLAWTKVARPRRAWSCVRSCRVGLELDARHALSPPIRLAVPRGAAILREVVVEGWSSRGLQRHSQGVAAIYLALLVRDASSAMIRATPSAPVRDVMAIQATALESPSRPCTQPSHITAASPIHIADPMPRTARPSSWHAQPNTIVNASPVRR